MTTSLELLAQLPLAFTLPDISTEQLQGLLSRWGYLVVFAGMLLENAGLPLPGETLTLLGGYAAGSGQLQVGGVIGAALVGAVIGDNLGYLVGRWAGWTLVLRVGRLLGQRPEQMEELRRRFLRHADASVLLGRFVAVLRVIAGPLAGAVGMPYGRFLLFNFAGAALWSTTMVSLAWLGGRWIPLDRMLSSVVGFGLGALVLIVLILLLPRLLSRLESPLLESAQLESAVPTAAGDVPPGNASPSDPATP